MSVWTIEVHERGVDLKRDRRPVAYDLDDVDEAMQVIRKKDPDATEATVIEPDGYRNRLRLRR